MGPTVLDRSTQKGWGFGKDWTRLSFVVRSTASSGVEVERSRLGANLTILEVVWSSESRGGGG